LASWHHPPMPGQRMNTHAAPGPLPVALS
jgi:hypothetical protein